MTGRKGAEAVDWRGLAACQDIDPDLFFPVAAPNSDAGKRQAAQARAVCRSCPARVPCLGFAVATRQAWGVWGGTTPAERGTDRWRRQSREGAR